VCNLNRQLTRIKPHESVVDDLSVYTAKMAIADLLLKTWPTTFLDQLLILNSCGFHVPPAPFSLTLPIPACVAELRWASACYSTRVHTYTAHTAYTGARPDCSHHGFRSGGRPGSTREFEPLFFSLASHPSN
jgi:hypothetical protein